MRTIDFSPDLARPTAGLIVPEKGGNSRLALDCFAARSSVAAGSAQCVTQILGHTLGLIQ